MTIKEMDQDKSGFDQAQVPFVPASQRLRSSTVAQAWCFDFLGRVLINLRLMSALPPKAVDRRHSHVRFVPIAAVSQV